MLERNDSAVVEFRLMRSGSVELPPHRVLVRTREFVNGYVSGWYVRIFDNGVGLVAGGYRMEVVQLEEPLPGLQPLVTARYMRPCPVEVQPPLAPAAGPVWVDVETGVLQVRAEGWWVMWRPEELPAAVRAWMVAKSVQGGLKHAE